MNGEQRIRQAELKSGSGEDLEAIRQAAIDSLAVESLDPEDLSSIADVDFGDSQRSVYPGGVFPGWITEIRRAASARRPRALRRLEERRKTFARCRTSEQARALYLRYCPQTVNWEDQVLSALQVIGQGGTL